MYHEHMDDAVLYATWALLEAKPTASPPRTGLALLILQGNWGAQWQVPEPS